VLSVSGYDFVLLLTANQIRGNTTLTDDDVFSPIKTIRFTFQTYFKASSLLKQIKKNAMLLVVQVGF
jgi:hypothetical protein